MDARFWAIVFCALMIVCVMLELLTPTLGGFTMAAVLCSGTSIYMGFRDSSSLGYLMIAANLALFPLALWLGLHFLKRSPLLHTHELRSGSQSSPDALPLAYLLGKQGQAITPLRPGGAAMIDGQRIDVVSESKFVEPGTEVKVIYVEGSRVVVEEIKK